MSLPTEQRKVAEVEDLIRTAREPKYAQTRRRLRREAKAATQLNSSSFSKTVRERRKESSAELTERMDWVVMV